MTADVRRPDDAAWDALVRAHPCGHLLQSSAWGRVRARQGWAVLRVGVPDAAGRLAAGAQALVRRGPLGALAYVPRGPVCAPDAAEWPGLLAALEGALPSVVALRVEPHWSDAPGARAALTAAGLREAAPIQPPSTLRLDLAPAEDDLLAGMKQKWRYNVRLAARRGIEVAEVGAAALERFEAMLAQTAARQGFAGRPAGYHAAVWHAFQPHAHLYEARFEGRPLAAILVVHHGHEATYLYGASTPHERARMPNHALQWEAIRRARRDGRRTYDFWGVPDAIGRAMVAGVDPDDVPPGRGGLWGVWRFKQGFGGEVWRAAGAWDRVYAPLRYRLGTVLRRRAAALGAVLGRAP